MDAFSMGTTAREGYGSQNQISPTGALSSPPIKRDLRNIIELTSVSRDALII
jgi:hypothetical protein